MRREHVVRCASGTVERRLRSHGAVSIEGAKAVGKTTLARQFCTSEVLLDDDPAYLEAVRQLPRLALEGDRPRLIDEHQLVPGIWNAVRRAVDDEDAPGRFLLTGSSTPVPDDRQHTGAGRIAPVRLQTLSLLERGRSSGEVSLRGLLDGEEPPVLAAPDLDVESIVEAICAGGWPGTQHLDLDDQLDVNRAYLEVVARKDVTSIDGRLGPSDTMLVLEGWARNTATDAALSRTVPETSLPRDARHDVQSALERLGIIEDLPAWNTHLRSRARQAVTPKRHLCDPSLAVAALGSSPRDLLTHDLETLGFMLESQVVHDLRVYANTFDGHVSFFRDNKGRELDAVVSDRSGAWIGVEVKLGVGAVEDAAASLQAVRDRIDLRRRPCRGLLVVTVETPTYRRPGDGVIVTSVGALGP